MARSKPPKRRPPYAPYERWLQLLKLLRDQSPNRVDGSVLGQIKVSQAIRSNLYSALKSLRLIDSRGNTNDTLKKLLASEGEEYRDSLRGIVAKAYGPMLQGLKLQTATPDQLAELFKTKGPKDEVGRKSMSFFVKIATEAGIPLSSQIPNRYRQITERAAKKRPSNGGNVRKSLTGMSLSDEGPDPKARVSDTTALVLDKFPDYDASWDEATVQRWRETIAHLLTSIGRRTEDEFSEVIVRDGKKGGVGFEG